MKTTCLDIELAIMGRFDYRTNLIVPNISNQMGIVAFETDMLVVKPSGVAIGFEIKTSLSDLRADHKKPQYTEINKFAMGRGGIERHYGKFKYFYYAVPESLKQNALELIHDFCGLYVFDKKEFPDASIFYEARQPKKLFDYKWSDNSRFQVARLGAMRIYGLKGTINTINTKTK